MNFIQYLVNTFKPKRMPLGRWRTETCNKQLTHKIELSNEDHCGPCGQYALKKLKSRDSLTPSSAPATALQASSPARPAADKLHRLWR